MRNGAIGKGGCRRPCSTALVIPGDGSAQGEMDFVSCVHCGRHHLVASSVRSLVIGQPVLGYCTKCDGVYCGPSADSPGCEECVPYERQIENLEQFGVRLPS